MTVANNRYVQVSSRQQRGFTLVELMVAVAIVAIITAVALPSYGRFVERSRLRTEQDEFAAHLESASELARSTGKKITIKNRKDENNWSAGYNIWVDENNNGTIDSTEEEIRYKHKLSNSIKAFVEGTTSPAIKQITLNADGTLERAEVIVFHVCPKNMTDSVEGVRLRLLPSGSVVVDQKGICTGGKV